jgi:hypothetical protein
VATASSRTPIALVPGSQVAVESWHVRAPGLFAVFFTPFPGRPIVVSVTVDGPFDLYTGTTIMD